MPNALHEVRLFGRRIRRRLLSAQGSLAPNLLVGGTLVLLINAIMAVCEMCYALLSPSRVLVAAFFTLAVLPMYIVYRAFYLYMYVTARVHAYTDAHLLQVCEAYLIVHKAIESCERCAPLRVMKNACDKIVVQAFRYSVLALDALLEDTMRGEAPRPRTWSGKG